MYEGYGGDFLISEGMRGLLMDVQTSPVTREGEQERQPLPHNQTLCQNSYIIRVLFNNIPCCTYPIKVTITLSHLFFSCAAAR